MSSIGLVSVVVEDYDVAIAWFREKLDFTLVEDTPVPEQQKRWVVMAPPAHRGEQTGARVLLARAVNEEQRSRIGNQTGGRVFLFLETDNFDRDFELYQSRGVEFVRDRKEEAYGTVAVFRDVAGNLWDLIELRSIH